MSNEFNQFYIDHGIERQHTVRNRPQQNGVAERANRTMEEGIIAMLFEAGLPLSFWGEALASFVHVWNRISTSAVIAKTPYEAFYGDKPNVSRLRVWGCVSYVHIQKDKRPNGSLGSHMEKCIFIGYPDGYKGWKFYNPVTRKAVIAERADFDERYFLGRTKTQPTVKPSSLLENPPSPVSIPLPTLDSPSTNEDDDRNSHVQDHGGDIEEINPSPANSPKQELKTPPISPPAMVNQLPSTPSSSNSPEPTPQPTPPLALRRPTRTRRDPTEWVPEQWTIRRPTPVIESDSNDSNESDDPLLLQGLMAIFDNPVALSTIQSEPRTYRQSQALPDAKEWRDAAEDELRAHAENGTWEIVKLPPGQKAIGSRWFMKIK